MIKTDPKNEDTAWQDRGGIEGNTWFLLYVVRVCVFLFSIMRLHPFLTRKGNHKSYFLKYYLGKGSRSPKETGMNPRPFSFAFISGPALRN